MIKQSFERHGAELFYQVHDSGHQSSGSSEQLHNSHLTLVFIHGLACDHSDWRLCVKHFQQASQVQQIIDCDLRGHGASGIGTADLSMETFGEDIAALLEHLDVKNAVLIGHSMGCRVSLEAWNNAPERIRGLVLIDGSRLGLDDPEQAAAAMKKAIDSRGYDNLLQNTFEQMFTANSDSEIRRQIMARTASFDRSRGEPCLCSLVAWDAGKFSMRLQSVDVPLFNIQTTTIDTDKKRRPLRAGEMARWGEQVQSSLPGARVVGMTGVGHFPMLDDAEQTNQLLASFIDSL